MKTYRKTNIKNLTSKEQFELFFSRIAERRQLEEEYYQTGNITLLPEIDRARESIREVLREMGIRDYLYVDLT